MSPKIFSITDREELRVKMLDAGFELIKQYGMTHARWRRSPKPPAGQEHLLQLSFPPRRNLSPASWSTNGTG